ncbi:hypothetical protein [Cryobacterium sp. PAMC25264]|uniref:hypothetical protein n=1 Tax=Cryobacterium sp. PAMC25264 TaxID=2861288 RepID=UPI001C62AE7F|nr:hypothetical protein [Cryobacterium sp. PAMC25264]QYF74268.1 hypothetical protein KY500_03335 [Cryobacterium sp. PAMC25264]
MAGLTAELEPVLDGSVLVESVLDEPVPVLDESVLPESVLFVVSAEESVVDESVPDESDKSPLSASVVVVVVLEVVPDTLVASVSAHSCRPSADAAITATRPAVLVTMAASLLPRSCRFIFRAAFRRSGWATFRVSAAALDDSTLRPVTMRSL